MNAQSSAGVFNPRTVLVMLVFGAAVFFAMLYFIGAGLTGNTPNDGGGHGGGRGLNGYYAMAEYLEAEGHDVSRSRSRSAHDDGALLVLTPPHSADAGQLAQIIGDRRYVGPTILVLPKWQAVAIPRQAQAGTATKEGWVQIIGAQVPRWAEGISATAPLDLQISRVESRTWTAPGREGALPDPETIQTMSSGAIAAIARDAKGQTLAGYLDDGDYPSLGDMAGGGRPAARPERGPDRKTGKSYHDIYPLVIIAEPDLVNNWGFTGQANAAFVHALVDAAMDDADLPVVFDMTLSGLGTQKNLLTLAFEPPFLAATICLMIALIAVGWRSFRRFGPPLAEGPAIAFGKHQLVTNAAAIIRKTGRYHLLGPPYAVLVAGRIAAALGMKHTVDDAALDRALAGRIKNAPSFADNARILRTSRNPGELLRASQALKSIERLLYQ
ncbi:DUF4350 domain-containing protein [Altererythrobacter aquiaggeris]|uniref:DUF4350 domain-containing protein n=1 Tax=Aestuarierythrobacter aquiaggeris TaxID=1898396 RepID=UPI003015CDEF